MRVSGKQGSLLRMVILGMVLISLSGCASLYTSFRASVEGVPAWTLQVPGYTLQSVFFVGEGSDSQGDVAAARQYAVEDLLKDVSKYLNESVSDLYRRELLNTLGVEKLALKVTDEFLKSGEEVHQTTGEPQVTVYLLAEADRKVISQMVRDNLQVSRISEQLINQPLSEGDAALRKNADYTAVVYYLQAAAAAWVSPLDTASERYQEIMKKAIQTIQNLTLNERSSKPAEGVFSVQVTRGSGLFAPKIPDVQIRAVYPVKNNTGKTREDVMSLVTNNSGTVTFDTENPGFRGEGIVSMYLDLSDPVRKLELVTGAGDPYVLRLREVIASKFIEFPFMFTSSVNGSKIAVSLLEFQKNGSRMVTASGLDSMSKSLSSDGVDILRLDYPDILENDADSRTLVDRLVAEYASTITTAVIGSAGIVTVVENSTGAVATAMGSVMIVRLRDRLVMRRVDDIMANGRGDTLNLAREAAFTRFGQIAAASIAPTLLL